MQQCVISHRGLTFLVKAWGLWKSTENLKDFIFTGFIDLQRTLRVWMHLGNPSVRKPFKWKSTGWWTRVLAICNASTFPPVFQHSLFSSDTSLPLQDPMLSHSNPQRVAVWTPPLCTHTEPQIPFLLLCSRSATLSVMKNLRKWICSFAFTLCFCCWLTYVCLIVIYSSLAICPLIVKYIS